MDARIQSFAVAALLLAATGCARTPSSPLGEPSPVGAPSGPAGSPVPDAPAAPDVPPPPDEPPPPDPTPAPSTVATAPAPRVWGVTVDDPWNSAATADALARLPRAMTARVVFDEGVAASDYRDPVRTIGAAAPVMGELLDSFYVKGVTAAQYQARAREYVSTLGPLVSIWEIGNEVNGEWLGDATDVVAKLLAAHAEVKAAGGKTALTLYYNDGCWARPENEMFAWVDANLPASLRDVDYVWVSYYEDDCNGLEPDWNAVFRRLAAEFPSSALGFGECGTTDPSRKAALLASYYGMQVDAPRFVGGYFWWYFSEDMVPATRPLWTTLRDLLAASP